jgi:DNA processing protein
MSIPKLLRQIPSPPKQLFQTGHDLDDLLQYPRVAIVGSRSLSPYGKQITTRLATDLAERGIVIISGLALGVDAVAHQAAVAAGGKCIAVLPSPLDNILPAANRQLAQTILDRGGALVSEYPDGTEVFKTNFVARNRLVAGLADVVLITEAVEKSGSLHTARFALEQGKDVLAVPGNITSNTSIGTNNLIKAGAAAVTSYVDVLHALGLVEGLKARKHTPAARNPQERAVIELLAKGISDGEQLQRQSGLDAAGFAETLTMLEISGKIHSLGANQWTLQ